LNGLDLLLPLKLLLTQWCAGLKFIVFQRNSEEGMRECFDISKARRVLGYEPKTELHEALEKTLAWIKRECIG